MIKIGTYELSLDQQELRAVECRLEYEGRMASISLQVPRGSRPTGAGVAEAIRLELHALLDALDARTADTSTIELKA